MSLLVNTWEGAGFDVNSRKILSMAGISSRVAFYVAFFIRELLYLLAKDIASQHSFGCSGQI